MIEIKSKTGKSSKKCTGAGRPRKITINDINESDREIYQEIMESILEDHGISKTEIIDRMKKRKDPKDSKQIYNIKYFAYICKVNRTSFYNP